MTRTRVLKIKAETVRFWAASAFFFTFYFSIIWSVGFTIESQAFTVVCLSDIRRMPMFSMMFLGGSGSVLNSLEFICFDFETIEIYLSYIVELRSANTP